MMEITVMMTTRRADALDMTLILAVVVLDCRFCYQSSVAVGEYLCA